MHIRKRVTCLLALLGAGCAASEESFDTDGLPVAEARALEIAPYANYVAPFDLRQLRGDPAARARATDRIGWPFWAARAELLRLDPLADASAVAVVASIGSCGPTDDLVVAVPSGPRDVFAGRVEAAIVAWRAEHPTQPPDDRDEPPDPALSRWIAVPAGSCTILPVNDYEQLGVMLTFDGLLAFQSTAFGNACLPQFELELPTDFVLRDDGTADEK